MDSIEEYLKLADEWGACMCTGDSGGANRLHRQIQELFRKILKEKAERVLFERADTVSDVACFWIASHLKEIDQPKALVLYDRLSRSPYPFVAFSAKYIIKSNKDNRR